MSRGEHQAVDRDGMTYTMPILTDDIVREVMIRELITDAVVIGVAVVAVVLIALFWRRRKKRF